MVLEEIDFDVDAKWWCVMGGAQQLAFNMRNKLAPQKIRYNRMVTQMSYDTPQADYKMIAVTHQNAKDPKEQPERKSYHGVFNSAPLGAQQHMKLEGLNLNWPTKQAIRNLGYGASCKIGIRFNKLWWITRGIEKGGVAKTDLPIRACVYPSYNLYDPTDKAGVLLASYTWSAEAGKIGALINRDSPAAEEQLKHLLFHDLAMLHAKTGDQDDYNKLYEEISTSYLDHYAYNWYNDPRSVGAFAYFAPGQFQKMWPGITASDGNYMIIGEAASAHHAWVVGSLESAVRGVYQFLLTHSVHSAAAKKACDAYNGKGDKTIPGPFGPLPAEYNRTEDVQNIVGHADDAPVASPIGELLRHQVIFENLRQAQGGDKLIAEDITKPQISPYIPNIPAAA